jgi:CHAD domain-containing protein
LSFQLRADESVADGIRRVVCEQIDKGLDRLTGQGKNSTRDEAVHDARKAFKKVRAVLRLVGKDLGSKIYQRENICFRDAARPLTEVRDAKMLVEAFDKLMEHFAGEVSSRRFAKVRQALQGHQRAVRRRVLDEEDALSKVVRAVKGARKRVKDWPIGPDKWSTVGKGLRRVYKTAMRAFAAGEEERTVENLHEWRKQVKYLWHQLQLLTPIWPDVIKELANQAHELADYLGEDHDLAVLRQKLVDEGDKFGNAGVRETLLALIDRRRDELEQASFLVGRRYYYEKPGDFADRLRMYWKTWRLEVASARV